MEPGLYLEAAVAVIATLLAITNLNPLHALLYLIVSLLAVATVFFSVGAPFAGILEVIIYAGAIMVLFVFVVMLLNLGRVTADQERRWLLPRTWIGPGLLSLALLVQLVRVLDPTRRPRRYGRSHDRGSGGRRGALWTVSPGG